MTPNPPKPKEFKGHTDRVCSICVAGEAEAALLYTGSEDGTVRSWNIDTCEMKKEYKGHKGAVSSIFVSEDNLLSASADKTVIHWNLAGEVQKVPLGMRLRGREAEGCQKRLPKCRWWVEGSAGMTTWLMHCHRCAVLQI